MELPRLLLRLTVYCHAVNVYSTSIPIIIFFIFFLWFHIPHRPNIMSVDAKVNRAFDNCESCLTLKAGLPRPLLTSDWILTPFSVCQQTATISNQSNQLLYLIWCIVGLEGDWNTIQGSSSFKKLKSLSDRKKEIELTFSFSLFPAAFLIQGCFFDNIHYPGWFSLLLLKVLCFWFSWPPWWPFLLPRLLYWSSIFSKFIVDT